MAAEDYRPPWREQSSSNSILSVRIITGLCLGMNKLLALVVNLAPPSVSAAGLGESGVKVLYEF